jgi:transcriptional regulator with XRE-family HTH domain
MAAMTPPGPQLPNDFGARVRAARAYKNLTREELGEQIGMSGGWVKNLENGAQPDALKARALLEVLPEITGLPEAFLLGHSDEAPDARLDQMDEKLDLILSRLQGRESDTAMEIHRAFEDMANRLGREVGKRPPQSRRTDDQTRIDRPTAA